LAGPVDNGSSVTLDAASGAASIEIKASTSGRLVLSGFSLVVSGVTGSTATLTFREKISRTVHYSTVLPANAAAATTGNVNIVQVMPIHISIPASQGLEIVSIGSGTVSGVVFIQDMGS
jgi:hypothetical protein